MGNRSGRAKAIDCSMVFATDAVAPWDGKAVLDWSCLGLDRAAVEFTANGQSIIGDEETPGSAAMAPVAGAMSPIRVSAGLGADFEADFAPRLAQQS